MSLEYLSSRTQRPLSTPGTIYCHCDLQGRTVRGHMTSGKSLAENSKRPLFQDVSEGRRRNMRAIRGKDSLAERRVRLLLHQLGYRYQLHARYLPGTPDIVFSARGKVVEVRGCFWHRHPDPRCRNAILPTTRKDWWLDKLEGTVRRDTRNLTALTSAGWTVLVVWECETKDAESLRKRLVDFLGATRLARR
jgi:DNA mismatch endonuclease Vsr